MNIRDYPTYFKIQIKDILHITVTVESSNNEHCYDIAEILFNTNQSINNENNSYAKMSVKRSLACN